MASASRLRAVARQMRATVDESTDQSGFWNVDAPTGYVWCASGTHQLTVWVEPNKADAIDDCLNRMVHGIEPCDNYGCELCS